ncbi:hypothetical protein GCM10023063_21360 [Arthrobacter methylotrophus]
MAPHGIQAVGVAVRCARHHWKKKDVRKHSIAGKKVAFLLPDGVEQIELTDPWQAVKDAGG